MGLPYFNNKKWSEITREERLFCFELFDTIRQNPEPFLKLIKKEKNENPEIGVEVCFYRDILYEFGCKVGKTDFPNKRTFDLALFFSDEIIIIEAKANQGFEKKQLESIKKDRENIKELFNKLRLDLKPKITIGAIYSSKYNLAKDKIEVAKFDFCLKWDEIAKYYPEKEVIFNRANDIYRH